MSPLPTDPKMVWPPPTVPTLDFAVWNEWYSGTFAAAGTQFSQLPLTSGGVTERLSGGFVHRHQNMQVGTMAQHRPSSQPVHCPLAADLAQTSADLLFGDMPDLRLTAKGMQKAQARLEELLDMGDVQNALLEAAEPCAALGGTYLRATWDSAACDYPFISSVDADRAVPEFRWGQLTAVTFWREIEHDDKNTVVLRHLERHEKGHIYHGVYRGTKGTLGDPMPLESYSETKGLQDDVVLPDGLPYPFTVFYVPNARPNQRNRGSYLGRADICGAEDLLDALDEVYSSLMRDVRLAQSRILIPHGTLDSDDPTKRGAGKSFDLDREIFTELDVPPEGMQPTVVQPDIRVEKHLAASLDLIKQIASKAGYSPQTFGLEIEGRAQSGTALRIREEKTYRTLGKKRRYWDVPLRKATHTVLALDALIFGRPTKAYLPDLEWQDEEIGAGEMANTLVALRNAEATSIETRVRTLNSGWDDERVAAEVARIMAETGVLVPPPAMGGTAAP